VVRSTKREVLGAVLSAVVAGVVVVAIAVGIATAAPHQAALVATTSGTVTIQGKTYPHSFLQLATFPDSMFGLRGASGGAHPDWVSYSNDNLVVPANSAVTVTVRQYDTGGTPNNVYFASVVGTVGGTETVEGRPVRSIPVNDVAHTLTLRTIAGNAPNIYLNIPLPAVSASAPNTIHIGSGVYPTPQVVTFTFITKGKGVYQWNCEYPCGDSVAGFGGAMSTYGYMSGTLTVS
jgi:hypothetical protein